MMQKYGQSVVFVSFKSKIKFAIDINWMSIRKSRASNRGFEIGSEKKLPQRWRPVSPNLLNNSEMADRSVAGDETWRFQYDLETKPQNMQWKRLQENVLQECFSRNVSLLKDSSLKLTTENMIR